MRAQPKIATNFKTWPDDRAYVFNARQSSRPINMPSRRFGTLIILLWSTLRGIVVADNCITPSCGGFLATVTSCDNAVGTAVANDVYVGCICGAPSLFDNDLQTCYKCVQSLGNQTLLNEIQGFLNVCVTSQTSAIATPTPTSQCNIFVYG